jgi:outer membrane protein assembly factor BamB
MFKFRTNPQFRALLPAGASPSFGYLLAAGVGLVVALFVLMAFSASRGGADTLPDFCCQEYLLPGDPPPDPSDALYPEGIAADNESGDFYVSSVADGSIYRGNVSSSNPAELFLPGGPNEKDGRDQATGLKLDNGRLFVAGDGTGKVFIYNASSGDLIRSFEAQGEDTPRPIFLNDLAINPQTHDAFITDSFVPILWRVPAEEVNNSSTPGKLEPWLDLSRTPIHFREGFNLNGIVATPGGRYLLTVQSNTGKLYRIDTQTEQVTPVDLEGAKLTQGDGMVLTGNTLYVIRNQGFKNTIRGFVTKISLDGSFKSGEVKGNTSVPSPEAQDFPTTAALVGGRLLVVNSQFAEEGPADPDPNVVDLPEVPFTVSAIPAP